MCVLWWISDYCVWSGVLPGQAYGVHCLLPEHHGVWNGEHSLPEGRVWSVCRISPAFGKCGAVFGSSLVRSSLLYFYGFCLAAGWAMSTLASTGSSSSWRRGTTLALRPTVAATPIALRGCCLSGPSAALYVHCDTRAAKSSFHSI